MKEIERAIKKFFENRGMQEFVQNFDMHNLLGSVQSWYENISLRSANLEYRWRCSPRCEEIRYISGSRNTCVIMRKNEKNVGVLFCSAIEFYNWWSEEDEDHVSKIEEEIEKVLNSIKSTKFDCGYIDEDEDFQDLHLFEPQDVPIGYMPIGIFQDDNF